MNIGYSRYGRFPTKTACEAIPTNCKAGYYKAANGNDMFVSTADCWAGFPDQYYPFCKLNPVWDELQAQKVYEDFWTEIPTPEYWFIMGEWCSRNQDSPYCEGIIQTTIKKTFWPFITGFIIGLIVLVLYLSPKTSKPQEVAQTEAEADNNAQEDTNKEDNGE